MHYLAKALLLIATFALPAATTAKEIKTNALTMSNAPEWLKRNQVEKVINRIQRDMEWTVRKIKVNWYNTQDSFGASHNLGKAVRAVTFRSDQRIHLGPKVTKENFDQIFAHELVHVISFQKYKNAIPRWLEEGVANHLARKKKVDYRWLSSKPFPKDVRKMTHPLSGTYEQAVYQYISSQALAEMLDRKCKLERLLQMSLTEGKDMNDFFATACEIPDLNAEYKKWVSKKAKRS